MTALPPLAQWFRKLGACQAGCGRDAVGTLFTPSNAALGTYCERCAQRAIRLAHKRGERLPDEML